MRTTMFSELLQRWQTAVSSPTDPQPPQWDGADFPFTKLSEDSRQIKKGDIFIARVRETSDGHQFIPQALANGAALIIGEQPPESLPIPPNTPYLHVADSALTTAWLSAALHQFPARQLLMIGITGTDGKTSTANILYELLHHAGLSVGIISTIKAAYGSVAEPLALHVTTPEAPVVQQYLRQMVDAGVTHCLLETTSHGLAQHRVAAIPFDIGIITNITHEHLDYHGSYEGYLAAKSRLLQSVAANKGKGIIQPMVILNRDDQSYTHLQKLQLPNSLTYGLSADADIYASAINLSAANSHFQLHLPNGRETAVNSALVGEFNVYNSLAAAAAATALGLNEAQIAAGLSQIKVIYGRMEKIAEGQPFQLIVDFAHTPNALEKAIHAARSMVPSDGRIITLFGSAGKRDVQKRRMMAEIAARDADISLLTAEDPRTESLDAILAMMAEGAVAQGGVEEISFWRIPDRGRAIYKAFQLAQPNDLVLICGKGHEQSMCFGSVEFPWDDLAAAKMILHAFLNDAPIPDSGLPTFHS